MHPATSTCQYGEGEDGGLRWPAARVALQDSDGAAELGPPSAGWAKLNTDGSFVAATGAAGGGMILRDDRGDIIFNACREINTCDSVLEAELSACREGIDLAVHRTMLPIIVELDSAEAVAMLKAPTTDMSQHRSLVEEISSSTPSC